MSGAAVPQPQYLSTASAHWSDSGDEDESSCDGDSIGDEIEEVAIKSWPGNFYIFKGFAEIDASLHKKQPFQILFEDSLV